MLFVYEKSISRTGKEAGDCPSKKLLFVNLLCQDNFNSQFQNPQLTCCLLFTFFIIVNVRVPVRQRVQVNHRTVPTVRVFAFHHFGIFFWLLSFRIFRLFGFFQSNYLDGCAEQVSASLQIDSNILLSCQYLLLQQ